MVGRELGQLAHRLVGTLRIQRRGGLVGQNHAPAVHQRPTDAHALALATGQLACRVLGPIANAQAPQQVQSAPASVAPADAAVDRGNFHIVEGAGVVEQVGALENESEHIAPQRRQLILVQAADGPSIEPVHAGRGPRQAADDVQQRRLAGSGRPAQADEFALANGQRHVRKRHRRRGSIPRA